MQLFPPPWQTQRIWKAEPPDTTRPHVASLTGVQPSFLHSAIDKFELPII
jgi:hypothetical protein